jgi:AcrR family transcriptional regulator
MNLSVRFHPPQQSRSHATLERLLDATERVLEQKSFSEATLAEIVEEAGVTVGAFYRRFPDKDALLHHLDDRFFSELYSLADELSDPARWEDRPVAQIVEGLMSEAVALYRARRGLMRSLFLRARTDLRIQENACRVNEHFLERIQALLLPRAAELAHPDPERAISLGFVVMVGSLRETILFGEVWPSLDRLVGDDLPTELARAYLAYLGATGAPGHR